MRSNVLVAIAVSAALVALAGCAPANAPTAYPQAGAPQTPTAAIPAPAAGQSGFFKPYPEGQGDTDGLSRDPEDCNRGCIGGNPD